jgi:succinoglycan biosynthesis transport protein ExoP
MTESERAGASFAQVLGVLRSRAPWILLCLVLAAGVAYGYSKSETKSYTATAAIAFNTNQLDQQIAGLAPSTNNTLLEQQHSDLELVKVGSVAAETARLLGHRLTDEAVSESLSISGKGESNIVGVSAVSSSPTLAAAIANTYASQFVKEQQQVDRGFIKSALVVVNQQLARLSPAQRFGSDGLDLEERAQTLSLLAHLGYNNVEVASEAAAPTSPSSPRTKRNTILGAILGLFLGLGVAFLLDRVDRRIRGSFDLELIYGLPMLGVVPNSRALSRAASRRGGTETALPAVEAEAFSLIRAHLRFFNIDRDLRTVAIVSPAPGDGKSTVAWRLAEAAARLGSRVLLLEIDLRHPTLAAQLDIQPGPGLPGVLVGDVAIDEAIQSVTLAASPGEGITGRTLDVLVAGVVLPPNPGELLESRAMDAVLTRARAAYDLVVVDTPPLNAVSDAFPLLTKVDGVVIVGWVGHSRREEAERLQRILAGSGAPLLGVIANGSKPSDPGTYANPATARVSAGVASDGAYASPEQLAPTAKT